MSLARTVCVLLADVSAAVAGGVGDAAVVGTVALGALATLVEELEAGVEDDADDGVVAFPDCPVGVLEAEALVDAELAAGVEDEFDDGVPWLDVVPWFGVVAADGSDDAVDDAGDVEEDALDDGVVVSSEA